MHWIKTLAELFFLLLISSQLVHAAPFIPTDDQQVLATLPDNSPPPRYLSAADFVSDTGSNNLDQTSELLERAYLQGDPRALGQARAQLDQTTDQSIDTLMLQARAFQSDHKFAKAEELLKQILSQDAAHPDALLTLSSLLLVQGQFSDAMSYCQQLDDPALRVYELACAAQIQSMTGELDAAKQTLSGLAAIAPGLDASTARWIYLIQADAALRSQDATLAKQVFDVMDDQTVPALMARADWLLSIGEYTQVRDLLQEHTDKDALLLRLITAQMKLNDPKAKQNLALMKERIDVWQIRQENAHMREQATYALLANQVDSALRLAQENWQQQRETADIELYATAALRANSQKDIDLIRQFITDTQFQYPALERDLRSGKISDCLNCQAVRKQHSAIQTQNAPVKSAPVSTNEHSSTQATNKDDTI
ncbi:tetratricopeptide repeat protein [Psychrobacter sp. Ps6]|uniref:tetratricopeptide repeat protein n=1 Tax=Psychrobacter sp. Ps6 TaxID=2790960 RepID=UPI001EDEBB59|nr:tetratricopeptide repeat protein [Psychrobacter sp. Ps6]MCG3879012.1 tetratricopeptide repeat protein [Psychrobacter sp. Ps6]